MFQKKFVEKIKTQILFSITFSVFFFFENRAIYEVMWKKQYWVGQATGDNMTHANCMLDNKGYKHTLKYVIILTIFPLQQWLHESAPVLRLNVHWLCRHTTEMIYIYCAVRAGSWNTIQVNLERINKRFILSTFKQSVLLSIVASFTHKHTISRYSCILTPSISYGATSY